MANDIDWRGLIQMVAPILGTLTQHGPNQAHFLAGWQRGQELSQQHARERQQHTEDQNRRGADYLLRIGEHAQAMDDPADLDAFLRLAEDAGTKAGYVQPGSLRGRFTVSPNKLAEKRLKELSDLLDGTVKGGYDPDQLAESGAVWTLKGGGHIPVSSALDLLRTRPQDAQGKPIPRPMRVAGKTEEERFIERAAREMNTTVDDLNTDELLAIRNRFRDEGRADKAIDPASTAAQFNDLVELWKVNHPGKEVPASVRTQLRTQANTVNDRTPATPRTPRDRYQVQPVTNPDGSTSLVRVNLETGQSDPIRMPTGVAGAGRPNESEHTSRAYLDRIVPSDKLSTQFEAQIAGLGAQIGTKLPNLLRSEEGQRYRQAQDEFINAALRRESGAAIQPSEYTRYAAIYFVQPGDTPATIKQKQQARQRVITGFRQAAGNLGKDALPDVGPQLPPSGSGLTYEDYLRSRRPR